MASNLIEYWIYYCSHTSVLSIPLIIPFRHEVSTAILKILSLKCYQYGLNAWLERIDLSLTSCNIATKSPGNNWLLALYVVDRWYLARDPRTKTASPASPNGRSWQLRLGRRIHVVAGSCMWSSIQTNLRLEYCTSLHCFSTEHECLHMSARRSVNDIDITIW